MSNAESSPAEMLGESVARVLADTAGFYARRAAEATGAYSLDRVWAALAEIGALGLTAPESCGGLGAGPVEAFAVCREFGRVALSTPYVGTALLAPAALAAAGPALRSELLPRIVEGRMRLAVSAADFGASPGGDTRAVVGRRVNEREMQLDGSLSMLLHLPGADLVMARVCAAGAAAPSHLAFVPCGELSGVVNGRLYDGTPVAEARLERTLVDGSRIVSVSPDAWEDIRLLFVLGCASEASGLADALVERTADHLRNRKAFGQTLDRFQALQHRMADLRVSQEMIRSAVALLIRALHPTARAQRDRLRHGALAALGTHVRRIGKEGVQLHGATGAMWEHFAGAALPRLMVLHQICGSPLEHARAYAEILRDELPLGAYRPLF